MPFVAYDLSIDLIAVLRPVVARLGTHDAELAMQLRTAATSVALDLAEGRRRIGKDRPHLWRVAAGSLARFAPPWTWPRRGATSMAPRPAEPSRSAIGSPPSPGA